MGSQLVADLYYDPYDYEIDADPYPVWRRMRDEAPLYRNDRHDFYALSRFADVHEASLDVETFSSAKGTVLELMNHGQETYPFPMMIFRDPPEHTQLRKLVSRAFSPRRIAALEDQIRQLTNRYLDQFVGAGGFDYVADFGAKLPMMVIGAMLGVPAEDRHAVEAELTREDGTTRRLGDGEVLAFIGLLSGAGNETVARLLGWTGATLARFPGERRKLVQNPGLIPKGVEELLRYEAPSPVQARWVTRATTWHGMVVPKGSRIVLLTGSAGRDEREYQDPDRFDVERTMERHVTFGYGIHFCLGASLARMEGRIAIEETLKRFPEWDVRFDDAEMVHTSTVRGWARLPIVTR